MNDAAITLAGMVKRWRAWQMQAALVLLGSALLAIAAHIQVPFWPVRISMQTYIVLAIGLACGGRLAAATLITYIAEGAIGLPVFQGGAGVAYMVGPTGGYLLGFVIAATLVGTCADRGITQRWPAALLALAAGEFAIYLPGVAWLAVLFGIRKSLVFGLYPFLLAEVFKLALAFTTSRLLRR